MRTRFGMFESSKKLPAWRAAVKKAALDYMDVIPGDYPLTDAQQLTVIFYLPRPKSVPRNRRPLPTVKPDWDKLARTMDSLVDAGLIIDDCIIVDGHVHKRYADDGLEPGASIVLSPIVAY